MQGACNSQNPVQDCTIFKIWRILYCNKRLHRNFTESYNTLKPNHVLFIEQLCLRRGLRKTPGKYVRAEIPWAESKSKLAAQSPIISLPNKLNTCFIHSSLHKQARDNSKVTLVTQFSIFNSIARFRKISVTLPKQLLYFTHDVTCDHVICRPSRTLIHGNLRKNFRKYMKIYREMVFKDCKYSVEAVQDCKELQTPCIYVTIRIYIHV